MQITACPSLFIELKSKTTIELKNLAYGGNGLNYHSAWYAFTPLLDNPIEIEFDDLQILNIVINQKSVSVEELTSTFNIDRIESLLSFGLLVCVTQENSYNQRINKFKSLKWWPLAALTFMHSRWNNINLSEIQGSKKNSLKKNCPNYYYIRNEKNKKVQLESHEFLLINKILDNRYTCRNFDTTKELSFSNLSRILETVWGVKKSIVLKDNSTILKKNSPSGGGLHSIEAYILAQRVENLNSGLYHYLPLSNSLEKLETSYNQNINDLALNFLAGQDWFKDADAFVIMTARFERLFWKYSMHEKALKVAYLDAGHLSQNFYLIAAELGLGVFISAAINDYQIEKALKIDPIEEGVIAILGIGHKSNQDKFIEL